MEKRFIYKQYEITFQNKDSVMVNATEMAKPFGKTPKDWLRTQAAISFITSLATVRHISPSELIKVTKGGDIQGTWMHEDVALEFARWLSPEFAIWCNDRIKELLKFGMTATPKTLEDMINNPDLVIGIATKLKEERARREIAEQEVARLKPRDRFVSKYFESENTIDMGQTAKILGYGRNNLFGILRYRKVLMRNNIPYQHFVDRGYFEVKVVLKGDHNYTQTRITPRGLAYIAKLLGQIII